MKRDLAILVVLTAAAVAAALWYPPKRWWRRPCAGETSAQPVAFQVVETAETGWGYRVQLGPWSAFGGRPHWAPFARRSRVYATALDGQIWLSSDIVIGEERIDPLFLAAELGAVATLFGLGLTWTLRRDRRRRALAPA